MCFGWSWNVNKINIIKWDSWLKICDSAEGPGGGASGPPVTELAVLSRPHEVLAATVIGVLVEGPVAIHDVAGVDVTAAEMILHWLAVVAELHHLTLEVGTLVDADAVGALAGLEMYSETKYKMTASVQGAPSTTALHMCLWFFN